METATLQLPKDLIDAAVQVNISAAIIDALKGKDALINAFVTKIMTMKVDSDGRPSTYSSDKKTYIEWLCEKALRTAVAESLTEEMEYLKPQIKAEIVRQLKLKNSPLLNMLVTGMTTGMVDAASNKWSMQITFK